MELEGYPCEAQPTGGVRWWITGKKANGEKPTGKKYDSTPPLGIDPEQSDLKIILPQEVSIKRVYSEIEVANSGLCKEYPWDEIETKKDSFTPRQDPQEPLKEVKRIVIEAEGKVAKTTVKVELTLQKGMTAPLELPFELSPKLPEAKLKVTPSIVSVNTRFTLQWECQNTSSYKVWEHNFAHGEPGSPSRSGNYDPAKKECGEWDPSPKAGYVEYTLIVENNFGKAEKVVAVQVSDQDVWTKAYKMWPESATLTGLCVSPDGNTLYAIVRSNQKGSIWKSADGFSHWTFLTAMDPEIASKPVVAFGSELVFAGGSKIDSEQVSRKVYAYDVENNKWNPRADANWPERWGHVCLVAPDWDTAHKVWVIGGENEEGNALNDAWVSTKLNEWEKRPMPPESPEASTPVWQARYLFGAAVVNSEVWIGGGSNHGRLLGDLWKFKWKMDKGAGSVGVEKVKVKLSETDYSLCGLALALRRDPSVKEKPVEKRIYVVGAQVQVKDRTTTRGLFTPKSLQPEGAVGDLDYRGLPHDDKVGWMPPAERCRMEAVIFNRCLWVFSLYPGEYHDELLGSELYYWVF